MEKKCWYRHIVIIFLSLHLMSFLHINRSKTPQFDAERFTSKFLGLKKYTKQTEKNLQSDLLIDLYNFG